MAAALSLAATSDRDLARGDTTALCMSELAESSLRVWARLRYTRELLRAGHVPAAAASLGLARAAVARAHNRVRRLGERAITAHDAAIYGEQGR